MRLFSLKTSTVKFITRINELQVIKSSKLQYSRSKVIRLQASKLAVQNRRSQRKKKNQCCFRPRNRRARRASRSPSASQRDALTSCNTLINCLPAITGNDTPAMTHGQKLSILLARASSNAPALYGLANKTEGTGWAGLPGCVVEPGPLAPS